MTPKKKRNVILFATHLDNAYVRDARKSVKNNLTI